MLSRATSACHGSHRVAPSRGGPRPRAREPDLRRDVLSRLVENLRERNGYCYSPRTSFDHAWAASSFVIQADVATASSVPSLIEIAYELGRIATKGVTGEELESARRYALGSLSFETGTQEGFANRLVAFAVMGVSTQGTWVGTRQR